MLAVAERVGVKAPSLYKRVASRDALIAAIAMATAQDLGNALEPLRGIADPAAALRAVAHGFRAFAHAHPQATDLLFADLPAEARTTTAGDAAPLRAAHRARRSCRRPRARPGGRATS